MYELCGLLGQYYFGLFHKLNKLLEILFNKHLFFKDGEQLHGVLNLYREHLSHGQGDGLYALARGTCGQDCCRI